MDTPAPEDSQIVVDWSEHNEEDYDEEGELLGEVVSQEKAKAKDDKKWSADATKNEKWHAPEGLFKKSPEAIAKELKKSSNSKKQAISRLTFYMNRAGKNLTKEDKKRLSDAKAKLREMYDGEKKDKKKVSSESIPVWKNW